MHILKSQDSQRFPSQSVSFIPKGGEFNSINIVNNGTGVVMSFDVAPVLTMDKHIGTISADFPTALNETYTLTVQQGFDVVYVGAILCTDADLSIGFSSTNANYTEIPTNTIENNFITY